MTASKKRFEVDHVLKLHEAGYRILASALCSAPGCKAQIWWFSTPAGKRQPRDRGTLTPHFATCRNAIYYSLRRRRETPAQERARWLPSFPPRRSS